MHLTYLGDTKIGAKSNIGAGTITCNYDGFHKFPTSIGNKVFIGSDSALVAPVRIGDGAYIAAGSTITDNVPPDALAIARGRQANKLGWASKNGANWPLAKNRRSPSLPEKKRKRAARRKNTSKSSIRKPIQHSTSPLGRFCFFWCSPGFLQDNLSLRAAPLSKLQNALQVARVLK